MYCDAALTRAGDVLYLAPFALIGAAVHGQFQ